MLLEFMRVKINSFMFISWAHAKTVHCKKQGKNACIIAKKWIV